MDNIVIGQYIKGNSWIYKLDPRVKLISLVLLIVVIFLIPNITAMLIAFAVLVLIILSTRIPFLKILNGLKPLTYILLFTFVLQLCYERTGEVTQIGNLKIDFVMNFGLYSLILIISLIALYFLTRKFIRFRFIYLLLLIVLAFLGQYYLSTGIIFFKYDLRIYNSGLIKASFVFIRILMFVLLSSILTFSTMPTDLNNGLESIMKPLKKIHVPVSEIAMMLSITLRFIPTLFDETQKIMKAQASRGVDFKESRLKDKVNQIISLLIPMFVISFQRAEELANAMEARGYIIGESRTKYDIMKIKAYDVLALFLVTSILFVLVFWRVY